MFNRLKEEAESHMTDDGMDAYHCYCVDEHGVMYWEFSTDKVDEIVPKAHELNMPNLIVIDQRTREVMPDFEQKFQNFPLYENPNALVKSGITSRAF